MSIKSVASEIGRGILFDKNKEREFGSMADGCNEGIGASYAESVAES